MGTSTLARLMTDSRPAAHIAPEFCKLGNSHSIAIGDHLSLSLPALEGSETMVFYGRKLKKGAREKMNRLPPREELQAIGKQAADRLRTGRPRFHMFEDQYWDFSTLEEYFESFGACLHYSPRFDEAVHRIEELREYARELMKYVDQLAAALAELSGFHIAPYEEEARMLDPKQPSDDRPKQVELALIDLLLNLIEPKKLPKLPAIEKSGTLQAFLNFHIIQVILGQVDLKRFSPDQKRLSPDQALETLGKHVGTHTWLVETIRKHPKQREILAYLTGQKVPPKKKDFESVSRRVAAMLASQDLLTSRGKPMSPSYFLRRVVDKPYP